MEELVQRAKRGDKGAFGDLVALYQDRLYRFCYRMLGTKEAAEDGAGEAFLKAFENIRNLNDIRMFKTWLFRIAFNICMDEIYRRGRFVDPTDDDGIDSIADERKTPEEEEVLEKEISQRVAREVINLPPREKAILLLVHYEGFSNGEAAEVLKIQEATLRPARSDAIRKLRQRLKDLL